MDSCGVLLWLVRREGEKIEGERALVVKMKNEKIWSFIQREMK